jgi:hypothetical protein
VAEPDLGGCEVTRFRDISGASILDALPAVGVEGSHDFQPGPPIVLIGDAPEAQTALLVRQQPVTGEVVVPASDEDTDSQVFRLDTRRSRHRAEIHVAKDTRGTGLKPSEVMRRARSR